MAKSKRKNTRSRPGVVGKKTSEEKKQIKTKLMNSISDSLEQFKYMAVFSIKNIRNNRLKHIIENNRSSIKIFYGKNKIMAIAIKNFIQDSLSSDQQDLLQQLLKGEVGLLFTNWTFTELKKHLDEEWVFDEFCRAGNVASDQVVIEEGPVPNLTPSMEAYLRTVKLPVKIKGAQVYMTEDYILCEKDSVLDSNQCAILKLLGIKMTQFHIKLSALYEIDSETSSFKQLTIVNDDNTTHQIQV